MDNREKWWPYKIVCMLSHGSHPSISYPLTGYVHINSVELCNFLQIPGVRLRLYLEAAQDMDMIEDMKVVRGFISCKIVLPTPYDPEKRKLV